MNSDFGLTSFDKFTPAPDDSLSINIGSGIPLMEETLNKVARRKSLEFMQYI